MNQNAILPKNRAPNALSVCMIVKDEENHLGDCLKSIQSLADQIVVVDTGSTDDTVKIADSYGATVVHSDWRNDFSYSRNISLDHATSRWILWLDADDRVPPTEVEKFKKLKTSPPDRAFYMKIRNVRGQGFGEEWFQLRMFPNHPKIRLERKIHEQIQPSLIRLRIPTRQVEIRVDHVGYENREMQRKKARRNLEILFADLTNYQEDPPYLAAIANSFFVIEEFPEAINWYKKILEVPDSCRKHPDLYHQTPTSIGLSLKKLGDLTGSWEWIEKALEQNSQKIDSLFIGAELKEEMGDISGAVKLYEAALQTPPLCSSCPTDAEAMKAKSLLHLGRLYISAGEVVRGEEAFRKCIDNYPSVVNAYAKLGELLLKQKKIQEAVEIFQRAIELRREDPKAYLGLAKALAMTGKIQEAAKILEEMKKLFLQPPNFNLISSI
jgi:glycosyltransferase involved in cell wall biosynthesis